MEKTDQLTAKMMLMWGKSWLIEIYTAKDLMQVVDFTSLMQFANKLYQAC